MAIDIGRRELIGLLGGEVGGGLMSYGANFPDLFRRAAEVVDKILRGTRPADIPVEPMR
jgi:putative ABC transport system substrate-binding protein